MYYINKLIHCKKRHWPLKSSPTHFHLEDELRWLNIQPTYHFCSACKCYISLYSYSDKEEHQINHEKLQPFAWIIKFNLLRLMLWHSGASVGLCFKLIHNRWLPFSPKALQFLIFISLFYLFCPPVPNALFFYLLRFLFCFHSMTLHVLFSWKCEKAVTDSFPLTPTV